jgi:hypothetical protein
VPTLPTLTEDRFRTTSGAGKSGFNCFRGRQPYPPRLDESIILKLNILCCMHATVAAAGQKIRPCRPRPYIDY